MIRTIRLDINAAYPQLPLEPVNVFAGSAASLTICNVPRAVGDRAISAVSASVKLKGGATESFSAVRVGSAWEVTIPATKFADPYSAKLGVRIIATGTDENKTAATWTLAVADLYVLNNVGSVTPGADAGDVKHSEFAALDADTSTLADVISILKGSAMALTLALASLFALPSLAALSVVPAYTNHNRVAGNVQTMTNLQQWAEAVETAIGQGGGSGCDTNAVQGIIDENVRTNHLCTVAAASAKRNKNDFNVYGEESPISTWIVKWVSSSPNRPELIHDPEGVVGNDYWIAVSFGSDKYNLGIQQVGSNSFVFFDYTGTGPTQTKSFTGYESPDVNGWGAFSVVTEDSIAKTSSLSSYYTKTEIDGTSVTNGGAVAASVQRLYLSEPTVDDVITNIMRVSTAKDGAAIDTFDAFGLGCSSWIVSGLRHYAPYFRFDIPVTFTNSTYFDGPVSFGDSLNGTFVAVATDEKSVYPSGLEDAFESAWSNVMARAMLRTASSYDYVYYDLPSYIDDKIDRASITNGGAKAYADWAVTTNNPALVEAVTNLAPSKARGISLADPVRHCNWYQAVTNGVFFWAVEE